MELTHKTISEFQDSLLDQVIDYVYRDKSGLHIKEDAPPFTEEIVAAMLALTPLAEATRMFGNAIFPKP